MKETFNKLFKKEMYLGAPVSRKRVITRKERQSDYFTETFKVVDYIDEQSKILNKTLDYEAMLKRYKDALKKAKTPDEYAQIEDKINELTRLVQTNQYITYIELTDTQADTILHNIEVESQEVREIVDARRDELDRIKAQLQELNLSKQQVVGELKSLRSQTDLANSLKFVVENNKKIDLNRGKGFSMWHSFRKHFKPYVETIEVKEVK